MNNTVRPGHAAFRRTFPAFIAATVIIFTTVSVFLFVHQSTSSPKEPAEDRPRTAPISTHPSSGFGFDLGPSYIAASIRYPNGSFDDIVFANVSDTYKQFFEATSFGPERCDGDWPKQRHLSSGLPLQNPGRYPAVDILASLFGKIKNSLQTLTGLRIDEALVSSPKLPGLCNEDIEAAMQTVGIRAIHNSRVLKQPHEASAAYAAYGHGLCANHTRPNPCAYEERWELPLRAVMVATYTDKALLVEYNFLQYAVSHIYQHNSLIDWQAGANSLSEVSDPQLHWTRIQATLLEKPVYWRRVHPKVDFVILAGSHACNETFVAVVKDTFARFQDDLPEILMEYGNSTGARGAAELAFRAQYQR